MQLLALGSVDPWVETAVDAPAYRPEQLGGERRTGDDDDDGSPGGGVPAPGQQAVPGGGQAQEVVGITAHVWVVRGGQGTPGAPDGPVARPRSEPEHGPGVVALV